MIKLYTIGCPACKVLEQKIEHFNIDVEKIEDEEIISSKGIMSVPVVELEDGTLLNFQTANQLLNEKRDKAFQEVK